VKEKEMRWEHLFSPFELKGLRLKNRIVMPPMGVFLVEADGSVTERTLAYYRRRAQGGAGMIMVEACGVAPEGIVSHHQMRIYDDRFIPGLARIAEAIKAEGARAGVQIHHAGRQTSYKVIGRPPLAPSPLPCPTIKGEVEPLDEEGIERIIRLFGDAAQRALEAGFELIEIHGAHGYLINQFLSGFSNIRTDQYGGDTLRRARFAVEVVREVRRRVGPQFPISFKISAQEFVPGGLTVEESIEIVRILKEAGIDAVQVSAGNDVRPEWISQPMLMARGCLVESAWRIKQAVDIPVMCVGRINGPVLAEEILREGKADLVCMGRALLADPDLPRKAMEGRLEEIRRCVACNTCINSIFKKGRVECLVNPELGREKEMVTRRAPKKRKVVVVGGGPAGCEAAWVAASRGHDVFLYEAAEEIGGQIRLGAIPTHKKELLNIIRFHKRQLELSGVQCFMGRPVGPEEIAEMGPEVVILATGAKPVELPFLNRKMKGVYTFQEALERPESIPENVVVAGGGAIGCEVALHLAEWGRRVSIVEMTEFIGRQYEAMTRKLILEKLKSNGVEMMTKCRIIGYADNSLRCLLGEDEELLSIEAEGVILAVGTCPKDELFGPLSSMGMEVHRIGDCVEPRSIKEAILEGARLARAI
jgi:2,4-dienoyl-CoA reductase-like NADH-dependent reductase (Old Yellow Enzyme family)/thioredoxin reductase